MLKRSLCFLLALIMFIPASNVAFARDELKNTDPEKYYILLDLNNQIVTVFEKDENGEYTRIVRRMLCTTGRTELDPLDPEDEGTPTPKGIWKIGGRERFGKFASFGNEYARYWTQLVGGVYFHSIMFSKRDVNHLKSGAFRNLGNNVSHGCIRMYVEDAKWLYYYACPGTVVNVSTKEPRNNTLKKALKTTIPFKEYNAMQKLIPDTPELPNLTAYVTYDNASLRTGNGNNDRVIKKLPVNTELEVLQEGEPWIKVAYGGKEGYVRRGYITYEKGVPDTSETADLIRGTVVMFTSADAKSAPICKVPTYSSVKVISSGEDGWSLIQYDGSNGYVKTGALTKGWGVVRP